MVLRFLTGACDLATLSVLLGLLEAGDAGRAGRRYGPASLAIMVGLSVGFALGGGMATDLGSGIFLISATFSLLLAVAAGCGGGLLRADMAVQEVPRSRPRYWPTLVFSFSDRGLAALMSVTASLYLIDRVGFDPAIVGAGLGGVLVLMGLGAWPAGVVVDRIGALPVRVLSVVGYATGFATIAGAEWLPQWALLLGLGAIGVFGAGLAPSAYVLASRRSRGALDMSGVQAAGSIGYFVGVITSGLVLAASGADTVKFSGLFLGAATIYLALNLPAIAAMAGWRVPASLSDI